MTSENIYSAQKPRALDLFCGGGGAGMGLHNAGYEVTGIDIVHQPDYPFTFIIGDASHPPVRLERFDFIWASPPCQKYSTANTSFKEYFEYIPVIRELLGGSGVPYCIENVPNAPIRRDLLLCGRMFGLNTIRHRNFEINGFRVEQPRHPPHFSQHNNYVCVCGHQTPPKTNREYRIKRGLSKYPSKKECSEALGISWMRGKALMQAIPPIYSEYIGTACIAQNGVRE
jgi:DNA (cytosine-5)-methyltransferase 1